MNKLFNIINGEDYTLDDARAHQKAGGSILRSAHIGNFDIVTLFLAKEGFPVLLHEHIKGNSKIYEPGYIKLKSEKFPLTLEVDLPLTHLSITDRNISGVKKGREIIKDFKNPAHFHHLSLLKLFPKNVKLASDVLLEQESFFQQALNILTKAFPFHFTQYIREDGTVFHLLKERGGSGDSQTYGSHTGERVVIEKSQISTMVFEYLQDTVRISRGENIKPKGIVMPMTLYVLLSTVCEIYKGRNGEQRYKKDKVKVMHFSGAAMIDYLILKKEEALHNSKKIEEMYKSLLNEMPGLLPMQIEFILIPTRVLKDFLLKSEKDLKNLDRLFLNYEKHIENTKVLNKRLSKEYFGGIRRNICKDVQLISTPNEISQYDLLHKNCTVFAPDFLFHRSHKYLRKMRNLLLRECASKNP